MYIFISTHVNYQIENCNSSQTKTLCSLLYQLLSLWQHCFRCGAFSALHVRKNRTRGDLICLSLFLSFNGICVWSFHFEIYRKKVDVPSDPLPLIDIPLDFSTNFLLHFGFSFTRNYNVFHISILLLSRD